MTDERLTGISDNDTPALLEFDYPQRRCDRVAIVGFANGHHYQAPFGDSEVETWGLNRLWVELPDRRWDRWFELHDLNQFYANDQDHRNFLKAFPGPVYVREQDYPLALEWGIETAQPFPHRQLLQWFRPYFNNSISWLVALAITMDFNWMGLYGVDMAQDTMLQAEYSMQRPSCEYFLGIAEGRGTEIVIPGGADLLKATHLYGYEDSGPVLEKMTSRWQELGQHKERVRGQLRQMTSEFEAQKLALEGQLSNLDGAMQEVTYWRRNWLTLPGVDRYEAAQ